MQARWVARVFSGESILPTSKEMRDEDDKDWIAHCENYIDRERLLLKVDYLSYMDMIASKIGCLPDLGPLWLNDWKLAYQLSFGPLLSCQYRLFGPGKWRRARETLLKNNFGALGKWNF
jgi:dimethylaniline monooxygenase (N-oxide forming)